MNRLLISILLAFSTIGIAQSPQIKSGSTVYIEPMGGYETYLAAALLKRHVPVVVVTDKEKADFVVASIVSRKDPAQPGIVINNRASANVGSNSGNSDAWNKGWDAGSGYPRPGALGRTDASISVMDPKTSQIVFAYSAGSYRSNQIEKTAEACAKSLKEFIEKSEKPKK
ncbi:MAG: hypothetical protein P4L51_19925 [Puia sp.]|nr:hypothetical protein [Puia sp.]